MRWLSSLIRQAPKPVTTGILIREERVASDEEASPPYVFAENAKVNFAWDLVCGEPKVAVNGGRSGARIRDGSEVGLKPSVLHMRGGLSSVTAFEDQSDGVTSKIRAGQYANRAGVLPAHRPCLWEREKEVIRCYQHQNSQPEKDSSPQTLHIL